MHKRTTSKIFARPKELRREMTPVERRLWARLRAHQMQGVHFRTQHAIDNSLAIMWSISALCARKGYRVLRFWNNDVTKDLDAVLNVIWEALG